MSRAPAHLDAAHNRDQIWAAVRQISRAGEPITILSVRGQLHGAARKERIRTYLGALERAGYLLARTEPGAWDLVRDCGVDAPRLRSDGTPVTQGEGQRAMWTVLRILREPLTPAELAAHACGAEDPDAPVPVSAAESYCAYLAKAGYLRVTGERQSGYRYQLIPARNSGPRAPQIQRVRQVYDPNLERVVWTRKSKEAADA